MVHFSVVECVLDEDGLCFFEAQFFFLELFFHVREQKGVFLLVLVELLLQLYLAKSGQDLVAPRSLDLVLDPVVVNVRVIVPNLNAFGSD